MRVATVTAKSGQTFVFAFWPGDENRMCRIATGYAVHKWLGFNWADAAKACRRIRGLDKGEPEAKHEQVNRR